VFSQFINFYQMAELYYAYNSIYRYVTDPFNPLQSDVLLSAGLFILNNTRGATPYGVSNSYTLFTLAKQAMALRAYKLAKSTLERLLKLKLPSTWRDFIEMGSLSMRTKPDDDAEELLPVCFRCCHTFPLQSDIGDKCQVCGHDIIRSFSTFHPLPLVEFELEGVTDNQALALLKGEEFKVETKHDEDVFETQLAKYGDAKLRPKTGIKLNETQFKHMIHKDKDSVYVVYWPRKTKPFRFFRNVVPEIPLSHCDNCQHFFNQEDYEAHVLRRNQCPFCRTVVDSTVEGAEDAE